MPISRHMLSEVRAVRQNRLPVKGRGWVDEWMGELLLLTCSSLPYLLSPMWLALSLSQLNGGPRASNEHQYACFIQIDRIRCNANSNHGVGP